MIEILKVSSKSNPNSVAGALAGVVRANGVAEIQVVGAGALNQAIKAVAIARGYMATSGHDLNCRPTFADIRIDGESRTAIRLQVESCPGRAPAGHSRPTWDGQTDGPGSHPDGQTDGHPDGHLDGHADGSAPLDGHPAARHPGMGLDGSGSYAPTESH